jgi:hypothetical protein
MMMIMMIIKMTGYISGSQPYTDLGPDSLFVLPRYKRKLLFLVAKDLGSIPGKAHAVPIATAS